jgi:hypothetical protein
MARMMVVVVYYLQVVETVQLAFKYFLTNKNTIAAKAKPIKGENNKALPTLIT